jgi:hypothetical protein
VDNPGALTHAAFFFQGRQLGTGMAGYKNMLLDIEQKHRQKIYIIGSAYNAYTQGLSFAEYPYSNHREMLRKALDQGGTYAEELFCPR